MTDPAVCAARYHPGRTCASMPPGWHDCPKHYHLEPDGHCECWPEVYASTVSEVA